MSNDITEGPGTDLAPLDELAGSHNLAIAIWFNDALNQRAKNVAEIMSKAEGFTPPHLIGKTAACFAVVTRALVWKLDPFAVAGATYQTPGGRIGYEGKLCHAILEASGKLRGGIRFEYYGDWSKVQGKFKIGKSAKGYDIPISDWKPEDEKGLGVKIIAHLKGESEPRDFDFDLVQAFPRNSTLWPTDTKTQLGYVAIRRFASARAPSLLMGVPFDDDAVEANMRDVTPDRPTRQRVTQTPSPTVVIDVPTHEEDVAAVILEINGSTFSGALDQYMGELNDDLATDSQVEEAYKKRRGELVAWERKHDKGTPEPSRTPSPTTGTQSPTTKPAATRKATTYMPSTEPARSEHPPTRTPSPTTPAPTEQARAWPPEVPAFNTGEDLVAFDLLRQAATVGEIQELWNVMVDHGWGEHDELNIAYRRQRQQLVQGEFKLGEQR